MRAATTAVVSWAAVGSWTADSRTAAVAAVDSWTTAASAHIRPTRRLRKGVGGAYVFMYVFIPKANKKNNQDK
jgi:hypothetical protein